MRAARAILWEFSGRHRWGFMVFAIYLAAFAVIKFAILGSAYPLKLDPPNGIAAFVYVPAAFLLFYLVGVFSHGLAGDLSSRQSIYPARFFTLPVSTTALAGLPMLYGMSSAFVLWLLIAGFMRAAGVAISLPWIWPGLLTAVYLGWMQALMWMPYSLPGLRVVVAVICLFTVDAIVITSFVMRVSEARLIAVIAPQIPLAFFVARLAVSRARNGEVPDWRPTVARRSTGRAVPLAAFATPARAQRWLEWRSRGLAFPAMVAAVLPFELWLLFIPGNGTSAIVTDVLVLVVLTVPFLALFSAATVAPPTSFLLARPVTTDEIIRAKFSALFWSAAAAWAVALVMVPAALVLSGNWPMVSNALMRVARYIGTPRAIAIPMLILVLAVMTTWTQLIQSLCVGLSGRPKFIKGSVLGALMLLLLVVPAADWIGHNRAIQTALFDGLPWIVTMLISVKLIAASWIAVRLYDRRALGDRVLIGGAVAWMLCVAALYAVLTWIAASPLFTRYFLGAIAILAVPLVRVSAAPLALSWSRHR